MIKYTICLYLAQTKEHIATVITKDQITYNWLKILLRNKSIPIDDVYHDIELESIEEYEEI